MINTSLDCGIFPDELKVTWVSPIYKSGDRTDLGNYRPISVLSTASKLYERVVYNQLVDYLDQYSLLSNSQFGFRRHHSTETCCLTKLDKIYNDLDKGSLSVVVFLDLEKAFDMVNHSILLLKLESIGVLPESCLWFASYLNQRQQLTRIDGCSSSMHIVSHGVPQGSILGPLLFLIFINNLCDCVELCGTSMYADDTAIFHMSADIDDLKVSMQCDLQSISHCMLQNRLSLNLSQTKLMMPSSKQRLTKVPEISLSLNGELVDNVETFKYLGMILEPQLLFKAHIDAHVNKSTNKLGLLYKTRWLFDKPTALALYVFDYTSIRLWLNLVRDSAPI